MQSFEKTLRNRLERMLTEALPLPEIAAKVTLNQLDVGVAASWYSLGHNSVIKKRTASMIIT